MQCRAGLVPRELDFWNILHLHRAKHMDIWRWWGWSFIRHHRGDNAPDHGVWNMYDHHHWYMHTQLAVKPSFPRHANVHGIDYGRGELQPAIWFSADFAE